MTLGDPNLTPGNISEPVWTRWRDEVAAVGGVSPLLHFLDTPRLALRHLGPDDHQLLQGVFEAAGDYFLSITGRPAPNPDAAEREIGSSLSTSGRHIALISLPDGDTPIGAIGWWEGNPEPDVALLGMLLIVPDRRRQGFAREALADARLQVARREVA